MIIIIRKYIWNPRKREFELLYDNDIMSREVKRIVYEENIMKDENIRYCEQAVQNSVNIVKAGRRD